MTILLQVLEQSFTPTTPWERRKFTFVDTTKIVDMRLDGQAGVWLDLSRPGNPSAWRARWSHATP